MEEESPVSDLDCDGGDCSEADQVNEVGRWFYGRTGGDICEDTSNHCRGEASVDTFVKKDVFFGGDKEESSFHEKIVRRKLSNSTDLGEVSVNVEPTFGLDSDSSVCSDVSVELVSDHRRYPVTKRAKGKLRYWKVILQPDKDGDNLLFIAIILGKLELCYNFLVLIPHQELIQRRRNKLFQTALHLAALTDDARLVRRLLVAGVETDRQDAYGNTALHIACRRNNGTVAETLLAPVEPAEMEQNSYEIAQPRIPQNLEIRNYEGQTCFMIAAVSGETSIMDLLLSSGADINVTDIKSGMTCLHTLTEMGNEQTVSYLLSKKGIDINARTYSRFTALDIANIRGHSKIAYLLLCAGAKPKLRPTNSVDFLAESDSEDSDS